MNTTLRNHQQKVAGEGRSHKRNTICARTLPLLAFGEATKPQLLGYGGNRTGLNNRLHIPVLIKKSLICSK